MCPRINGHQWSRLQVIQQGIDSITMGPSRSRDGTVSASSQPPPNPHTLFASRQHRAKHLPIGRALHSGHSGPTAVHIWWHSAFVPIHVHLKRPFHTPPQTVGILTHY
ncbi:hypothetical protein HRR83_003808 [Exophiala dermatitidis]|nr:hypothetical protein HRR74_002810 [Exophiala dermatitidis]KAJ4529554.1 hypothetical protein HRR73_000579 [Exophiala dermatitidis]KAJ4543286.1 hypothetical protein HRR77_005540 [Exophiala dermatitidis]KAJ4543785.1 hypothetical protein HRR76_001848 [Exophiala dermatitidis]KAJ4575250.1 hypothetical protein HRR79_002178 [Exophiala dermatitidis]